MVDRGLRHRSITSSRPCGSGADRFNDFWREEWHWPAVGLLGIGGATWGHRNPGWRT